MLTQQGKALRASEHVQGEHLHAKGCIPLQAPTGQQHLAATVRRTPPRQQSLGFAVVEDQQTRQRFLPGPLHELDLFIERETGETGRHWQPLATCGDFCRYRLRLSTAQPEDPTSEELPVAIYKLTRQL